MESLSIENPRNAIDIGESFAVSSMTSWSFLTSPLEKRRGLGEGFESLRRKHAKNPHLPPLLVKERRPVQAY
jgi:hypothetical protein